MAPATGTILLSRADNSGGAAGGQPRALLLFIGGDTLGALARLLEGVETNRPLALDLLWKILERGQEISQRHWKLLRMGIVAMRDGVYIGRLFFGDAETGEVLWDCDCRPSDGFWLAVKAKAAIYVKSTVWEECATAVEAEGGGSLDEALASFRAIRFGPSGARRVSPEGDELTGTALYTTVQTSDPEYIKRLKREMRVAIGEEDYKTASRLRDHPWMQLYRQSLEARSQRNIEEAQRLENELARSMEEHDRLNQDIQRSDSQ